ncbi:Hsp20/alpha crystallin family protein [Mesobacillus maritimus]|uniref:Hsp20/alpha crystallin family protein n=1 Tax=Mesobacillus maritimus TaxID=1643336 RepID=UPI0038511688
MEAEKWKNWLDLTKQYAAESFWKEVFNQSEQPFSGNEKVGETISNLINETKIKGLFPRCDMFEEEDQLYIQAELPGISREDVVVSLRDQELVIQGNYSTLKPRLQYYLKERSDRSFEKSIKLPVKVNKQKISSSLNNGLLTIMFPIIKEEDAVPIHIEISPSPIPNEVHNQE